MYITAVTYYLACFEGSGSEENEILICYFYGSMPYSTDIGSGTSLYLFGKVLRMQMAGNIRYHN